MLGRVEGGAGVQVKVLLDAGAEVFVCDVAGNTPRDYCSDYPVRHVRLPRETTWMSGISVGVQRPLLAFSVTGSQPIDPDATLCCFPDEIGRWR